MKIKRSVECWVLADRTPSSPRAPDVLLLRVPALPGSHDAFWQPITGGIEPGEGPRTACAREVREETGLALDASDLIEVADALDVQITPDLTIRKTLFAARIGDVVVSVNPDEHVGHCWVRPEEVDALLHWDSNRDTWRLIAAAQHLPTEAPITTP